MAKGKKNKGTADTGQSGGDMKNNQAAPSQQQGQNSQTSQQAQAGQQGQSQGGSKKQGKQGQGAEQQQQQGVQQGASKKQQQSQPQGGQQQGQQKGGQQQPRPQQQGQAQGAPKHQPRPQHQGQAQSAPQQQQQRPQQQGQPQGAPQQQQQRPQQQGQPQGAPQQQQQRPQQAGGAQQGGWSQQGAQQQLRPQQQGQPQQQQQRPQLQGQPQSAPQQQQQRPQQAGGAQQGAQQQLRPQQAGGGQQDGWSQQGAPQQQQRPQQAGGAQQGAQQLLRPQQAGGGQQGAPQQQQRPQQAGGGQQGGWSQQGAPQQQQRPQQAGGAQQWAQQQQRPQQSGGGQQGAQQQQQRPQQGQQQGGGWPQKPGGQQQQPRPQQSGQQQGGWAQKGPPQQQQGGQQQRSQFTQSQGRSAGGSGSAGKVETNYLELDLSKMPNIAYHYDVAMDPDKPKKFMRQAFELFSKNYPKIIMAYDGAKSCYCTTKLPHNEATHEVEVLDSSQRKCKFKVTVKETSDMEVDLASLRSYQQDRIFDKPMRALQCLEVVLANPCHERGIRAGRSFYRRPERKADLEDGYELWIGLYQAAILGDKPFLNVDIAHKSFPSGQLLTDYISNSLRADLNRTLERYQLGDLRDYLRTLNVVYEPPPGFGQAPRTYRVNNITDEGASRLSFTMDDGKKYTIAEYFKSKSYNLKYPQLNCLHVGSSTKNVYLPIELCRIQDGQATNKKVGPRQVSNIIKFAATSTNERKTKIETLLQFFNHNNDNIVRAFGIGVKLQFLEVPYRCLAPPMLIYNGNRSMAPNNGSWRSSLTFYKTKAPNDGHKWAIIYADDDRNMRYDMLNKFSSMMTSAASRQGVNLQNNPFITTVSGNNRDPKHYIKMLEQLKKEKTNLVVVVLPPRGFGYADVKQTAELKFGILTQCIKSQTMSRRLDEQVVGNLLLKINAKLNGTNHIASSQGLLKFDANKIMFLGADVTHPSPDQREIPSVVGTAASHDNLGACYNMQYRLQRSTLEAIDDMEGITYYHLMMYKEHQGTYPSHLIYYRDGVSDGQFPIIIKQELGGIKKAFHKCGLKNVAITCIIVVKRHHTRFFPKGEPSRFNKFNNVDPGTLVDQRIVHPNEMQFFMVSHQSIQGTAKPTRYNVIYDDMKLTINQVQEMSHALCHMFPRCNRAVSYPAPAYLAHLVAYRGRVYLEGTHTFPDLRREYEKRQVSKDIMQQNPMYFV